MRLPVHYPTLIPSPADAADGCLDVEGKPVTLYEREKIVNGQRSLTASLVSQTSHGHAYDVGDLEGAVSLDEFVKVH
tara:strand:+ start:370 stop:600 length:231 start_codon:yes stop_codon:yes gene_type:complete